jgi:antitoxin (DNA-binding transcriptional repressor) of toxin-antitoxin stability system
LFRAKGSPLLARRGIPVAALVPVEEKPSGDVEKVIEQIKAFSRRQELGNLTIRELIEEGRRF